MPSANGENAGRLVAPAGFDGPTKNRHCTDVLCFLMIIVSWVVMSGVGWYAVTFGDVRLIIYPLDYDGNICGTDFNGNNMTDFPNLLYLNSFTGGVCVKECPNLAGLVADNLTDMRTLVTYDGVFQYEGGGAELPADYIQVADYSNSSDKLTCTNQDCIPNNSTRLSWQAQGVNEGFGYAYYAASTYELLFRCYLTIDAEKRIAHLVNDTSTSLGDVQIVDDIYNFWNKLYADVYLARKYVFGFGLGLSMAVSLVYIFLMRLPGLLTGIVWMSILTSILMFFLGGYYAWNAAAEWEEADPRTVDDTTINITTGGSIACFIIGLLLILITCCLRRSIMEAIKCTREAGKAVNSMTLILLVPILQSIGLGAFLVPFMYYAINLASLGEITTKDVPTGVTIPNFTDESPEIAFRVFEFDDFTKQCGWYMLFCLFWTANFVIALGDLIIAVSVSKWYFTKNKWTIGSWTVLGSIWDVLWYHAGTAAYGSLLVAIVQMIRAIIAKIQKQAKKADNKLAQCVLCCCQCCFYMLEVCLKFINKNAYIQTAIFSTSFCTSCRESFALIFRNVRRVAAITYVSAAVLIVGKLFISSVVTIIAYYVIVEDMNEELYSVGGPVAIVFLLSYWISDMFMDVLDMGISTVLHCFIADEEMFDGDTSYTEKSLKDYVDKHGAYPETRG